MMDLKGKRMVFTLYFPFLFYFFLVSIFPLFSLKGFIRLFFLVFFSEKGRGNRKDRIKSRNGEKLKLEFCRRREMEGGNERQKKRDIVKKDRKKRRFEKKKRWKRKNEREYSFSKNEKVSLQL